jgi:hypothetical protein
MLAGGCAAPLEVSADSTSPPSISYLNATANDAEETPDERCLAIFSLFKDFIKPGSTPREIQAVLTDTRWLEPKNLRGFYILLGWIPVQTHQSGTAFVIEVLPKVKPSTGRPPMCGYHIYVALSGVHSDESAYATLTGQPTHDTQVILDEFALCYPDGRIEVFTAAGVTEISMDY